MKIMPIGQKMSPFSQQTCPFDKSRVHLTGNCVILAKNRVHLTVFVSVLQGIVSFWQRIGPFGKNRFHLTKNCTHLARILAIWQKMCRLDENYVHLIRTMPIWQELCPFGKESWPFDEQRAYFTHNHVHCAKKIIHFAESMPIWSKVCPFDKKDTHLIRIVSIMRNMWPFDGIRVNLTKNLGNLTRNVSINQ